MRLRKKDSKLRRKGIRMEQLNKEVRGRNKERKGVAKPFHFEGKTSKQGRHSVRSLKSQRREGIPLVTYFNFDYQGCLSFHVGSLIVPLFDVLYYVIDP